MQDLTLFIYNPHAGDPDDPSGRLRQATQALINRGLNVKVVVEKPKKQARKQVKKALKKGCRRIVTLGGDGTIEAVAHEMVGSKAVLGIFKAGTENNIAESLGIPDDINRAAWIIAFGVRRKLDVGKVKVKHGKKAIFFEQALVGMGAELFEDLQKLYDGQLSSVLPSAAGLVTYQIPHMRVKLDGKQVIEGDSAVVIASNTPVFSAGLLVAPDASPDDGLLDVSFYPDLGKVELLAYFESIMRRRSTGSAEIQRYRAKKIKIKTSPKQRALADGVLLGKGTVKIKVKRGQLRVMTGQDMTLAEG